MRSEHPMTRPLGFLAVSVLMLLIASQTTAQTPAPLEGTWLVRRAGTDELVLRLALDDVGATLEAIGSVGRWDAAPPDVTDRRGPIPLSRDAADTTLGSATLTLGDWHGRLVSVGDGLAL